jgi:glycosyltransferase involved in cell wall biosynthesis
VATVRALLAKVRDGGRLFLSTPCGAYDQGHPEPHPGGRDPRGHVRAMTRREMVDVVRAAGGEVEHLENAHGPWEIGNTMQVIVRRALVTQVRDPVYAGFAVSHFVRKPDPITFVVPSALWDWHASHVEATGIGASEETIVYLAKALAEDATKRVEVYGPVPEIEVNKSVAYWPREQIRKINGGPIIVSRSPSYFKVIESQNDGAKNAPMVLWLQDAYYADLNPETAARYAKIVVLTEWHKQAMIERCGIDGKNLEVIENFLLRDHFQFDVPIERKAHRFIYPSSPDRGLIPLLKLWPRVLEMWPDAELHIFYGWEGCKRLSGNPGWNERYMAMRADFDRLKWQKGVFDHGRVNHRQLALAFRSSDLWAYVTSFEETGCLTAAKARAAGCVPVVPRLAALGETADCDSTEWILPWYEGAERNEAYVAQFLSSCALASQTSAEERQKMSDEAVAHFDLHAGEIMAKWRRLLEVLK